MVKCGRPFSRRRSSAPSWRKCILLGCASPWLAASLFVGLHLYRSLWPIASKRKRPVGQPLRWRDHRQAVTALKAEAAGYQLKRGARKPLLDVETEPGVAVAWSLDIPHPLCVEVELDDLLRATILQLARHPAEVQKQRATALQHWGRRAHALLPATEALLANVPDAGVRKLLRGAPDSETLTLGHCCHIALYYEMLQACGSVDAFLPDLLLRGCPIVGPIARPQRWPPYAKPQPHVPVQHAVDRAWGIRSKIIARVKGVPV